MKLNRQPDAPVFARRAAGKLEEAIALIGSAASWSSCAGARPAVKGIMAARIKIEGWHGKLVDAAKQTEEERR
jgi:hypothetical protein